MVTGMATKTTITITDDITGEPDATAHTFALNGRTYTIDLADTMADALADALAPFIDAATVTSKAERTRTERRNRSKELAAVREWAAATGHAIPARGRIPDDVMTAYQEAHAA